MELLKKHPVLSLLVANLFALAILLSPQQAAAGGDYCPDQSPGCKCWDGGGWSPPGCYDQAAPEFLCHGGDWCPEPGDW
jgi:hypothetical protein